MKAESGKRKNAVLVNGRRKRGFHWKKKKRKRRKRGGMRVSLETKRDGKGNNEKKEEEINKGKRATCFPCIKLNNV